MWTRDVGPGRIRQYGRAIRELDNGDLLIAGYISDENFTTSAYVMRTVREVRNLERSYISSTGFGLTATSVDVDGGNIVVGGTDGNFAGSVVRGQLVLHRKATRAGPLQEQMISISN
ncbi:MAG: hypothetical protein IPP40_18225 [bacterium]|nr:hypothetical protein [bacterium]